MARCVPALRILVFTLAASSAFSILLDLFLLQHQYPVMTVSSVQWKAGLNATSINMRFTGTTTDLSSPSVSHHINYTVIFNSTTTVAVPTDHDAAPRSQYRTVEKMEDVEDQEDPDELCPIPDPVTECSVMMLRVMINHIVTGCINITVNMHQVLVSSSRTGLHLVQLSSECQAVNALTFGVGNVTDFPGYVNKLTNGTLLIGMSGDHAMLSHNVTHTLLIELGVGVQSFNVNSVYGFVAMVGYQGVAKWNENTKWNYPLIYLNSTYIGRAFPIQLEEPSYPDLAISYPEIQPGGHWRPSHCRPRWKVAIIIPFRNRHSHLRIWLNNLLRFMERQNLDFKIYVVEQTGRELFNRAALMNIGYKEAKSGAYDCYIFHDVDLIPEDMCNLYECGYYPRHLAVAMNKYDYKMPYKSYFGGVISMTSEHMESINGFSNILFGWGGEDDDITYRLNSRGLIRTRDPPEIGRYVMLMHGREGGNPKSHRKMEVLRQDAKFMQMNGLNSLKDVYSRQNPVETTRFYTHIYAQLHGPTTIAELEPFYEQSIANYTHRWQMMASVLHKRHKRVPMGTGEGTERIEGSQKKVQLVPAKNGAPRNVPTAQGGQRIVPAKNGATRNQSTGQGGQSIVRPKDGVPRHVQTAQGRQRIVQAKNGTPTNVQTPHGGQRLVRPKDGAPLNQLNAQGGQIIVQGENGAKGNVQTAQGA